MSNTKSTLKDMFLLCLLPVISLFSFLFYVFWAYPVQILSQELTINEHFLFNNPYLQTSLLVCVILFIALIITSKFLPKLFLYVLGFILVFLIGTFLYKYTIAYNYGGFIDNNTLATTKPLLGYSFWFFTLDIIFPILSIIIAIFALKKNFYKPILLLFFLFYSTENILTFVKFKPTPTNPSSSTVNLVLSKNQPNLIFLMVDSLSTPLMLDIINNKWDNKQKAWTKDFMFYDNVTTLSLGGTVPSLPNMIGGYEFSPQNALTMIKTNKINFETLDKSLLPLFNLDFRYHTEVAFNKIKALLNDNIDISAPYDLVCILDKDEVDEVKDSTQIIYYRDFPIINVSLYSYIPYLFRNNLIVNHMEISTSFNWRKLFYTKWISYYNSYGTISVQQTEKPVMLFLENIGAHGSHISPKYPDGGTPRSTEDIQDILYEQITYNTSSFTRLINILKKQNIYDSTRIILAADHGIYTSYIDFTLPYLQEVALENSGVFYTKELQAQVLNPHYLPVTVMDKKFNTTQEKMQIDSRFLSIGDLHGSIVNTFTNNNTTIDYLDTLPPKRQFNIPSIPWTVLLYFGGKEEYKLDALHHIDLFAPNGNLSYITVKDIKKGEYIISNYNFDNIGTLPPVEYLE